MRRVSRRGKGWLIAAALVALAAALVLCLARPAALQSAPPPGERLLAASQGLDEIVVIASYKPETRTLAVRQTLALVNRTGEALSTVALRAYPNAFETEDASPIAAEDAIAAACYPEGFTRGKLDVRSFTVNGASATWRYADDARTVALAALTQPWQPGETLALDVEYAVLVPKAAYRFGVAQDVVCLGNALLAPAVWQNGDWRTDAYAPVGDPFFGECRNYRVSLAVPAGWAVGGTATALPEATEAGLVYRMEALAVRDFACCLSPRYQATQRRSGDAQIVALATDASRAAWLAEAGAQAMDYLQALLGAYPYPTLTLCEAALSGASKVYPGLTMASASALSAADDAARADVLQAVAHQWAAALVGADGIEQPWQIESLCEYLVIRWAGETGRAALREQRVAAVEAASRVTLGGEVTPGMPVGYFPDTASFDTAVRERGAGLFLALETFLGEKKLAGFLRAYCEAFAFRLCSRDDFEALLHEYTGEDLSPLLLDYLDTLLD